MIIKDCLPLSVSNGEGFSDFFFILKLPLETHYDRKSYNSIIKKEWATDFNRQARFVYITTNTWTSRTPESYILITTEHLLADEWTME